MKITLSEIYKAMIEQADYVNFNNTINSLEYCKTEIELKENNYMKTSEFKAELGKMGYVFGKKGHVNNLLGCTVASVKLDETNILDTFWGETISDELFSLLTRYAATPIDEREDEKLFNVQIIKGNWGRASWIYRNDYGEINTSSSSDNDDLDQLWTLEQIKEYGIDDETVYKRVPAEDEK